MPDSTIHGHDLDEVMSHPFTSIGIVRMWIRTSSTPAVQGGERVAIRLLSQRRDLELGVLSLRILHLLGSKGSELGQAE
jgi:hypothetical protein